MGSSVRYDEGIALVFYELGSDAGNRKDAGHLRQQCLDIGLSKRLDSLVDRRVNMDVEQTIQGEQVRLERDLAKVLRRQRANGGLNRRAPPRI